MTGFLRRVIVAMLLGVAVYGVIVAITGFSKIQSSLTQFHWSAFAIALGMASGNYALRVLKWEYYLARLGIRGIPKFDSALIFLSGFVLTVTPGKVGEIFKSAVLFRTHNVSVARTAPIVVAERLTDLVGIIIPDRPWLTRFLGRSWVGDYGSRAGGCRARIRALAKAASDNRRVDGAKARQVTPMGTKSA
jgi:hypothetical protein